MSKTWIVLVVCVLSAWLLYLLSPVLTPFLISALLAYLGSPAVDRLQKLYASRTVCVTIVFLLMFILGISCLTVLIPLLENQFSRFFLRLPEILVWLETHLLGRLSHLLNVDLSAFEIATLKTKLLAHWQTIGQLAAEILSHITSSGQRFISWLLQLILIPVVTFYLLRDWKILCKKSARLLPRQYTDTVIGLLRECNAVLAEFLRGQLLLMLAQGILYSVGLWFIGLEFALLIGMLSGILSFVPYLGVVIGVLTASITAYIQFQELLPIIYVLLVFSIGQMIEGMILSPWLIGERIGLHPVAVIFAVMAGAELFGLFGVLIALPVAAIVTVLLRYVYRQYIASEFYAL